MSSLVSVLAASGLLDALPYLAGVAVFIGLGVGFVGTITYFNDRVAARASLRALDGYANDADADAEELAPFKDRVGAPVQQKLVEISRKYTPVGYIANVRRKLIIGGKPLASDLDRFLAIRVAILIASALLGFLMLFGIIPLATGFLRFVLVLLIGFMGFMGPDAWLNRKMAERQKKVRRTLPDILDLLTISVEAGLGFEQALDRVVASVPGPLSDEFRRMLGEMRAGSARSDAMKGVDERTDVPEVRAFVLAVLQADQFGVSIGRILRSQADEMRVKRRQMAQEEAQKAPVKMLIPMVFCIFPSLFVVLLGPAMINIRNNF